MIVITHIRLSQNNGGHEHITHVWWKNTTTGQTGDMSKSDMVNWLNQGNHIYVTDGHKTSEVGVVNASPPYLRTHADGYWNDNLLALPRL